MKGRWIAVVLSGMLVFTAIPVMAAPEAEITAEEEAAPEDIAIQESAAETVGVPEEGTTDENTGIRYIRDGRPLTEEELEE